MRTTCFFLTLLFLLTFPLGGWAASSVKITIDAYNPQKIEVGETFHITVEATNCAGKLDVTQMPPGVKVVYHTSQQASSTSVQNGKRESSTSTSLIMTCKGEKEGKYTFGPVAVDGVKSNTLSYQIVAASGSPNGGKGASKGNGSSVNYDPNGGPVFVGKGNEEMFLTATVNKSTAYEQEAIEYVVKLYTTYGDIKFLGAAAAPKFDGFVVEESDDVSTSFKFEDFKGKSYKTAIIARYIIFPQKSGKLKVIGNTYTVSTDAYQYYHDPYFQQMTVKYPVQLNVTPNEVDIEVKELPKPIPENFIGGVGKFSISSSLPSSKMATNTPASLIINIEGTGNVKYLKMPDISALLPNSIEVYSPDVTTDIKVGTSNVTGHSRFDYSIIPREAGDFTIPALHLEYFDPSDGQYKQLETKPYHLNVALGVESEKSQQSMIFNPELLPVGELSQPSDPYVYVWTYWLWYAVPVLILMLSLTGYRKYMRDHEDLTLLRSKKANKMALKRLAKAYQCFQNNKEEQFYDEMLMALWGYIGDKLKMPPSELNRNNVSEEFKKHGVKESTFMPIINLIDECEYAKYTPVSREANMRQLYADALESLAKVENEYEEETGQKAVDANDELEGNMKDNYVNTMDSVSSATSKPLDLDGEEGETTKKDKNESN